MNKHLVLVVQDRLLDYMAKEFSFGHLEKARTSDPMHFHPYCLKPTKEGHRLDLMVRLSTDTAGIATCLGLQGEAKIELAVILRLIKQDLHGARCSASIKPRRLFPLTLKNDAGLCWADHREPDMLARPYLVSERCGAPAKCPCCIIQDFLVR